jgi:cell division protein FtsN
MTGRSSSHDFAGSRKPAPASPKKGRKPHPGGVPAWIWTMAGTLAGALVMYLVYISGYVPSLSDRKSNVTTTTAQPPAPKAASTSREEPPAPPKRTSPVFEFYTKLPESGAPTVDSETLHTAQQSNQPESANDPAAALQNAVPVSETVPPLAENMDPIQQLMAEREAAKAPAQPVAQTASAPSQPVVTNSSVENEITAAESVKMEKLPAKEVAKPEKRLALQTGAFRKRAEADAQRAKLLLLGISAKVQPASNGIYRVVAGPFDSQADMDDARILLDGNHINNIPVK